MTRYSLSLALVALLVVFMMGAQAQKQGEQADKPAAVPPAQSPFDAFTRFSATLNGGLGRDTNRKIYRLGNLMRFDFPDHYRISDLHTRASWIIYPNKCSKFPMLDPGVFPFSRKFRIQQSSTSEGKEIVDGHTCKIEDVVLIADGPMPTTFKMKLYKAEDLGGFPLKINVENATNGSKYAIHYSDVSLEPPHAKLFEHPAKCDSPIMKPATQPESKPAKPAKKAPPKPAPKPE